MPQANGEPEGAQPQEGQPLPNVTPPKPPPPPQPTAPSLSQATAVTAAAAKAATAAAAPTTATSPAAEAAAIAAAEAATNGPTSTPQAQLTQPQNAGQLQMDQPIATPIPPSETSASALPRNVQTTMRLWQTS